MKSQMRLTRTSGSVGGLGGRPPRSTRPLDEWQQVLLGCLTLQERSDGPEVILAVTECDLAGLLDCRGWMATGKAQKAQKHSHALDAAGLDHRLGPTGALRSQ